MYPKIVLLIVCLTTFTSGAEHNPKVHEDQIEKESGSVRNIRNPVAKQKAAAFQPPTFNFRLAQQQQDHLKHRYAQQQKLDFKNELYMRGPAANVYSQGRHLSNPQPEQSEVNENWQPFQPRSTKQNPERQSKMQTGSSTKSATAQKPATREEPTKRKILKDSDAASSEVINKKDDINRQDVQPLNFDGEIVYVHPSALKQLLDKNGAINNPNSIGGVPERKYNALSDLVGKNPNFQLEGLKQILMQDVHQNSHTYPAIQGPKPFKSKDHTPIVEKSVDIPNPKSRPNVEVIHEEAATPDVASLIQQSPAISQNSLESLQKQLDEASNIQAQKVWEKATKDAQAHVEAQHKAIEDAQKAILQKFNFNEHPQALALIQKELPEYALPPSDYKSQQTVVEQTANSFYPATQPQLQDAHGQALALIQKELPAYALPPSDYQSQQTGVEQNTNSFYPTPQPQLLDGHREAPALIQKELPTYALPPSNYHQGQQTGLEQNANSFYPTPQPQLQDAHQILQQSDINKKIPAPVNYITQNNNEEVFRVNIPTEHDALLHQTAPVQSKLSHIPRRSKPHHYPSKNVEFYAPNHVHQAASQGQAEKALVESQNSAVLNNHKKLSNVKHVFKDVPKVVDTFQQIVLDHQDSGKVKNIHKKSPKQQDENNDVQYAARYAFGYSVKDAKEGNDFGHQERRIGKNAEGRYYVVLPDGRKQNVQYYADTTGYHAKVTYEHAQHS